MLYQGEGFTRIPILWRFLRVKQGTLFGRIVLYLHGVAVVNVAEKWLRDPTISPGWRPLCSSAFFLQPPSRILISDASGNGKGGFCLESGW